MKVVGTLIMSGGLALGLFLITDYHARATAITHEIYACAIALFWWCSPTFWQER